MFFCPSRIANQRNNIVSKVGEAGGTDQFVHDKRMPVEKSVLCMGFNNSYNLIQDVSFFHLQDGQPRISAREEYSTATVIQIY